jgi:succinyl-CoA synthetase beta subunit
MGLAKLFEETDCSLLEINPLVVTTDGDIHCLDAKINIDGNALYRQPAIAEMNDPSQEDEREAQAAEYSLNYVALEGQYWLHGQRCGSGHGHHGLSEAAWW